jgi:hypothetical protein
MNLLTYRKPQPLNLDFVVFTPVKKCTVCKQIKCFNQFNKHKNRKYGLTLECKSCRAKINFKHKQNNKDLINKKNFEYRENKREEIKERGRIHYKNNKFEIRKDLNEKYKNDPVFRLKTKIRNALYSAFRSKSIIKNSKMLNILGTSFDNFQFVIESQFKDGMTWENMDKWHIDHKVPLSLAKTEDDLHRLNHYTNFQPLWVSENLKKNNKLFPEHEELHKTLLSR